MAELILLFGGRSRERLVAVATAQNVARNLPDATCWFWAPDGSVHRITRAALLAHEDPFRAEFTPVADARWPSLPEALETLKDSIVFPALHGGEGENGAVQTWLEARGIAFVGSGASASAAAFDKGEARRIVAAAGVRVAAAGGLDDASALFAAHGAVVLKPALDGSSFGLYVVRDAAALERALAEIPQDVPYLVEAFIAGTELTVGVIEDADGVRALPAVEIRAEAGHVFDFEGKYLGTGIREICPAEVAEELVTASSEIALVAHRVLGCRGYSRTDVILGPEGPVYLETNTLPGLTASSLLPQELRVAGIAFERFLRDQIALARR